MPPEKTPEKASTGGGPCSVCHLLGFGAWGQVVSAKSPSPDTTKSGQGGRKTDVSPTQKTVVTPKAVERSPSIQGQPQTQMPKMEKKPSLATITDQPTDDKSELSESEPKPSPPPTPSPAVKPGMPPKKTDKSKVPVSRRRKEAEDEDSQGGFQSTLMVAEKKPVNKERTDLEILQNSLSKIAGAEEIGKQTLATLALQREQLLRIDDDLNTINQCMARCERMIKGMESLTGTFTNMLTKPSAERDHRFKMPSTSTGTASAERKDDPAANLPTPREIKGSEECEELRLPQQLKDKGIELSNSRATELLKEDTLQKAAESTVKYQERVVRVYQSRIEYYVPGKLKDPRGSISITAKSRVGPGVSTKQYAFSFVSEEGKRKYEFAANSEAQKREWVTLLTQLVHEKVCPPPKEERIIFHYYTQHALAGIGKDWTSDCVLFTSKRFIQIEKDKVVVEVNLCDLLCVEMPPSKSILHHHSEKLIAKKAGGGEVVFKMPKDGAQFFNRLFSIMLGELTHRRNTRTMEELMAKDDGSMPAPVRDERVLEDEALDNIGRIAATLEGQADTMSQEFDLQNKLIEHIGEKVESTQERIDKNDKRVQNILKNG